MTEKRPTLFSPAVGRKGMTTLHYAAYCGDLKALRACLESSNDIHEKDSYRGYNVAHWVADMSATSTHTREMLRLLIEHGIDLSVPSDNNETVLSLLKEEETKETDVLVDELERTGTIS